ncbi:RNA polymerase sigma factor [Paraflavitalea pollutisoli]|uniref:RNA polymerase sigma factor n=1 Tax=Paraflavitalea pollutisoli TaxID=3034143 RepID=UPI0023EB0C2F|nr:sigma-70 family RNA polymerase sigma factor [Paraflavitalea sp. H1-2-19X]
MQPAALHITLIQKGDAGAFEALYHRFYKKLCYFVDQLIHDSAVAEEVVADTLNKCYRLRERFGDLDAVEAFCRVTCRNAAYDHLRAQKRVHVRKEELTLLQEQEERLEFERTALHALIEAETMKRLHDEINKLPQRRREVIQLYYLQNLRTEEIAEKLQITTATVHKTRQMALEQLKNVFTEKNILASLAALLIRPFL